MTRNQGRSFVIGIITMLAGAYLLLLQSMKVELGANNVIQVSTVFDGGFLILMGAAMIIAALLEKE
ncbi:hypothetical protein METP1_02578 [Methanosarcinales archaeon]|nr:hypothetical protein METP1_02578 [Methanosarcinales archaeon]